MAITLIEDAPAQLGSKISYQDYFVIPKSRLKNPKKFSELFYDGSTGSYGIFEGKEAIDFLKLLDYEDTI